MQGMQQSIPSFSRLLTLHSLVSEPMDDCDAWLQFASMVRRNGRFDFSMQILTHLQLDRLLEGGHTGGVRLSLDDDGVGLVRHDSDDSALESGGLERDSWSVPAVLDARPRSIAPKAFEQLVAHGTFGTDMPPPRVALAYIKQLWAVGHRSFALNQLGLLTDALDRHNGTDRNLRVHCHLRRPRAQP